MVRIASPNPDHDLTEASQFGVGDPDPRYKHPADQRKNYPIPVAFQVTSPFNRTRVLLPHSLVMHINPNSFEESFTQKVERFQTRGGWVEQHWGQELTQISAGGSTGAFMHIETGLSSIIRQRTIAWDRYRDLHDLYRNNGSVYDPFGNIVLQGYIMLMYDRGVYLGSFRDFETDETADSPFAFTVNWTFKVEHTLMTVPYSPWDQKETQLARSYQIAPRFQSQNIPIAQQNDGPPFQQPKNPEEADQAELDAAIELEAAASAFASQPTAGGGGG